MEISSKAWHLRLVRLFEPGYQPSNLCGYFWRVVLSLLFLGLAIVTLPPLVAFFGIGMACAYSYKKVFDHHKPRELKKPSLIVEFIKAKKRRVCPLITVVGE